MILEKLKVSLDKENNAHYYLKDIYLNNCISKSINIKFESFIFCKVCQRKIKKTYNQGYCFVCFKSLAECDMCLLKPETCHFHLGTCRDESWGRKNCFLEHYVYLSDTGKIKVGVTRKTNFPNRFIDQGASKFLPIFETKTRILAGKIEVFLKQYLSDRTNWQLMLKSDYFDKDLYKVRKFIIEKVKDNFLEEDYKILDWQETKIKYPILEYPKKVKALNLEKLEKISSKLLGIKGQYLILESGVLNIRKYSGFLEDFTYE